MTIPDSPAASTELDFYPIEFDFPDIRPYAGGNAGIPYAHTFDSGKPGKHTMITALTHGNEVSGAVAVKAMLVAARIPYVLVAPVTWQKHLDLPKRGRTPKGKAQHKRDLRDAAQALFPGRKVTLQTADALLMFHLANLGKIAI